MLQKAHTRHRSLLEAVIQKDEIHLAFEFFSTNSYLMYWTNRSPVAEIPNLKTGCKSGIVFGFSSVLVRYRILQLSLCM